MDPLHILVAFGAAFLAGAINSVGGGGTLVSFPALIWLGLNSVAANATSTVAIWPGTVGSAWGYRRELVGAEPRFRILIVPSLIGGITGALLLRWTPPAFFDKLVPYLILFATLLFMAQEPVQRMMKTADAESHKSAKWLLGALLFQLGVAIYGGYFGAGMGIMMLTELTVLGMTDILKMNALTSLYALCVNGIAAVLFSVSHMVRWHFVLAMAVAAVAGGWGAAGVARRVGRTAVRRFVIALGYVITVVLFIRIM